MFVDGSDDEVRAYLLERFGTEKFCLVGSQIRLELPLLGKDLARPVSAWRLLPPAELAAWLLSPRGAHVADAAWSPLARLPGEARPAFVARAVAAGRPVRPARGLARRPRPSGESVIVTVDAPGSWTVERPERGPWWHAVPAGSSATLCTIELASWQSRVRDDDEPINCPWCRARLIAIEIAAPPPNALSLENEPPSAENLLRGLIGQTIYTIARQRPNEILAIERSNVIVGTASSPSGEPVSIAEVQAALDMLYRDGSLRLDKKTVGYRSAFIGAFLAALPDVTVETNPRRASLKHK